MTRVLVLEIEDVPRVVFARGEGEIGDDGDDEGDGGRREDAEEGEKRASRRHFAVKTSSETRMRSKPR